MSTGGIMVQEHRYVGVMHLAPLPYVISPSGAYANPSITLRFIGSTEGTFEVTRGIGILIAFRNVSGSRPHIEVCAYSSSAGNLVGYHPCAPGASAPAFHYVGCCPENTHTNQMSAKKSPVALLPRIPAGLSPASVASSWCISSIEPPPQASAPSPCKLPSYRIDSKFQP